jgi:hypothetical protein
MEEVVSEAVLAEIPARVLRFLGAVARSSSIRTALATKGYRDEDQQEGWTLLHKDAGFANPKPVTQSAASKALAELDAWDEPNFRIIRATLQRRYPALVDFVFANDLVASSGNGALLAVRTLLNRLQALRSAPERKATRKQDHAALAVLAGKGLTEEELARIQSLVEVATQAAPVTETALSVQERAEWRANRLALHGWYLEWSETARAVIKRRNELIALGLATRRVKPKPPEEEADSENSDTKEEGGDATTNEADTTLETKAESNTKAADAKGKGKKGGNTNKADASKSAKGKGTKTKADAEKADANKAGSNKPDPTKVDTANKVDPTKVDAPNGNVSNGGGAPSGVVAPSPAPVAPVVENGAAQPA